MHGMDWDEPNIHLVRPANLGHADVSIVMPDNIQEGDWFHLDRAIVHWRSDLEGHRIHADWNMPDGRGTVTKWYPLEAPANVSISGTTLTWGAVADASGYRIYVDGAARGSVIAAPIVTFDLAYLDLGAGLYSIQVRALGEIGTSALSSAVTLQIDPPAIGRGPSGGRARPGTVVTDPEVPQVPDPELGLDPPDILPPPPPSVVTPLPTETVEAEAVSEETAQAVEEAVESTASALEESSGMIVTPAGPPVYVSVSERNTVATLVLPEGVGISQMTTMAVLNDDGTLTPVPTRVGPGGNIIVLVSGDVTLVPLNVVANFIDIDRGAGFAHVAEEIRRAASLMIIEGRGGGIFDPTAHVTNQEAATMFLRAIGVPVQWATAMATAAEQGFSNANAVPNAPITRIETAQLIVSALRAVGMEPLMAAEEAAGILAAFTDLGNLSEDEQIALAITVELGIFRGAGGGLMNPNQNLQRSQMASLAVRLQDVILGTA